MAYENFLVSVGVWPFGNRPFAPTWKAKAMPLHISFQPVCVLIHGRVSKGNLVLADNQPAAVIVRVDGECPDFEHPGLWHLEAGFGKCVVRHSPLFKTCKEAGAWVEQSLTRKDAYF